MPREGRFEEHPLMPQSGVRDGRMLSGIAVGEKLGRPCGK
jgi:hypothetical protein